MDIDKKRIITLINRGYENYDHNESLNEKFLLVSYVWREQRPNSFSRILFDCIFVVFFSRSSKLMFNLIEKVQNNTAHAA